MEEWNEHIEEIIQHKSFEDLSAEDFEVLGEIASDAKSYESYRQLLNNVIPAVKEENIQPSSGLNDKIRSIIEKDNKKGGGYYKWVKYAAAAAILIGVFAVSYWIIENNSLGEDVEVAQNNVSEKGTDKNEKSPEKSAENSNNTDSVKEDRAADEITTGVNENDQETSFSEQEEPNPLNKEEVSGNSMIDKVTVEEEVTESRKRIDNSDQLDDLEAYSETEESSDELNNTSPSMEGALKESNEKKKVQSRLDNDLYDSNADISSTTNAERSNSGGVYANAPAENDVRDEILGTIELAKPASSQEDAFDLLTIAF